jgi:hypothetical protein
MFIHIPDVLSRTDHVGRQWVQTEFIIFLPGNSFFYETDAGGRCTRFRIPLRGRSVLAWYIRLFLVGVALLAAVVGSIVIFGNSASLDNPPNLTQFLLFGLIVGVPLTAFGYSFRFLGSPSKAERARRRILGEVTGFNADPAIFNKKDVAATLEGIRTRAKDSGLNLSAEHWNRAVPEPQWLPLLFALAMYEKQFPGSEAWQRLSEDFWKMLRQQMSELSSN